jgi:uncharacterized protein YecA (UPF0149 family)
MRGSYLKENAAMSESISQESLSSENTTVTGTPRVQASDSNHGAPGHVHGPGCAHAHGSASHDPFVRDHEKVGRNDPCPCGSQQKFKKCHGK